jgi:hypothetical protein
VNPRILGPSKNKIESILSRTEGIVLGLVPSAAWMVDRECIVQPITMHIALTGPKDCQGMIGLEECLPGEPGCSLKDAAEVALHLIT